MSWTSPHCCRGHLLLKASSAAEMYPPFQGLWFLALLEQAVITCGFLVLGFVFFFLTPLCSPLHFSLMGAFPVILLLDEEASLFLEDMLNYIKWIRRTS